MWILVEASLICSCWMSVLTAMKSTWLIPASIIRSTAFRPAPPTPTTRMTARYDALSRARSRRAGCSGSGSSQRAREWALCAGRLGVGRDRSDRPDRRRLGRSRLLCDGRGSDRAAPSEAAAVLPARPSTAAALLPSPGRARQAGPHACWRDFCATEHLLCKVTVHLAPHRRPVRRRGRTLP